MSIYKEKRKQFYSKFPSFWSDLYGGEYSLYHIFEITEQTRMLLREATERMGKIFFKTARLLRTLPDEQLLELGFPHSCLPFIRMKTLYPETVIGRFDFALTKNGFKMLALIKNIIKFFRQPLFDFVIIVRHMFKYCMNFVTQKIIVGSILKT